jgi:S-adenosylmethionine:tRNA ribosyltransferase-isomerase
MFSISDYHYTLPIDLIAQEAIRPHHDARLMIINREWGNIEAETTFWNIDRYIGEDRVIFFNNSRVVRSRVVLTNIAYIKSDWTKSILKDGEIFYLSTQSDDQFTALVRPGNKFKVGTFFIIDDYTIEVVWITENGRILKIVWWDIASFLAQYGTLPLPPYIEYSAEKEADYQTSFAKTDGSVAAPTASLHFTTELMQKIKTPKEYITLHVGLGTFKWIQTADIRDYDIHREKIEIDKKIFEKIANTKHENKKIVAVGTTACRTLESLPHLWQSFDDDIQCTFDAKTRKYWDTLTEPLEKQDWIHDRVIEEYSIFFETSIYITPGYQFGVIDDLITNFHLGESSLLVLVSAFIGYDATMSIYRHAIESRYRFYSFGDGMYIRGK